MFNIPLEYLMFGGIGFCLAWLMALMVMPAVHNRAVRLARKRYDDLPLSMQEIRAEKDTIRAGFAAATRDLEVRIEKLKEKTSAHATDLAKKSQLIDRLKQEIGTVTAALRESEVREQTARDELREAKREFADKDVTLGATENAIAAARRELATKQTALQSAELDVAALTEALAGKDSALQTAERNLAAARSELAGKDFALTRAEKEIVAIKAEIGALTTLLLHPQQEQPRSAPDRAASRQVDVIPLVPAAARIPEKLVPPARIPEQSETRRPPLDVVPAPSRLVPPAIPQAQPHDSGLKRPWTDSSAAGSRAQPRHEGVNQRLRALYAPLAKTLD